MAEPVVQRSVTLSSTSSTNRAGLWLVGGAIVISIGVVWWWNLTPRIAPAELLTKAFAEQKAGRHAPAEALAAQAYAVNPQLTEAAIVAAKCAMAQQEWTRALAHLDRVMTDDPATVAQICVLKARVLHYQLNMLLRAERAYRCVLAVEPDHIAANEGLVQLLALCGRKSEAVPLILQLIRRNAQTDTLLLLAKNSMVVNNAPWLKQAQIADPLDPHPLVGLAWHALENEQFREAEMLLREAIQIDRDLLSAHVLLGRLLVAKNRTDEFADWAAALPETANEAAEAWLLRGQMAEALGDGPGATRCFGEAVRWGPESKTATFRLAHGLAEAGDRATADQLRERIQQLQALEDLQNRVLFTADRGHPELLLPLAQAYEATGRLWEAYGWSQFAISVGVEDPQVVRNAERLQRRLQQEPLQLVTDAANIALTMDLTQYPIPTLKETTPSQKEEVTTAFVAPTFREDASAVYLDFRYFNGVSGPPTHRMFEFTGGGAGVLDFDLNGYPDVIFTQGCAWPPGSPDRSAGDRLFRNVIGSAFEDVTESAGLREAAFGQGVTVGDFNADGFPDVYVANIGQNALWFNAGDGTFHNVTIAAGLTEKEWTTSTIMVDLTGDGLPDIYDVNYADDADTFDRVCQHPDGSPRLCLPSDFHGEPDCLWRNLGDGRFEDATVELLGESPLGLGLGVAAWSEAPSAPLSLFIANDTTPCFLFRADKNESGRLRWHDEAITAGVAFNGAGKATGCMGVAVGDIDDDGRMDLHITNFYAEPNTLFVNSMPGFFEDQTRRRGLEEPSLNMLGFGTQFLDADLDGQLELFVSNGHVDDLTRQKRPYKMPAQVFGLNSQGQFAEFPAEQLGPYFQQKWLGRPAARLDWNRDGRDDLVVGHLEDRSALLTNTTASIGRHLSLRLIGTQGNRDAIGTTVQVRIGKRKSVRQLSAGDGYQCSNERRLIFGTGRAQKIDELTVWWPSGVEQRFQNIAVPVEWCLREGHEPLPLQAP